MATADNITTKITAQRNSDIIHEAIELLEISSTHVSGIAALFAAIKKEASEHSIGYRLASVG